MEGDQFERQRQMVPAAETSPATLIVGEMTQREQEEFPTINQDPEALQEAGFPPVHPKNERANCRAFIETFKFKSIHLVTQSSKVRQEKPILDHLPLCRSPEIFL